MRVSFINKRVSPTNGRCNQTRTPRGARGAAAAAAASEIRPINAKRLGKRPVKPAPFAPTPPAAVRGVPDPPASRGAESGPQWQSLPKRSMPGADLPDFENGVEATDAPVGRASKPPAKPPPPPARDGGGNPLLLQSHSGVDPDELCASQEHALSSYLKLHPALSLESTNYQTLQLVANLVEQTSIATKELEIVPKSHDDEFLRCKPPAPPPPPPHPPPLAPAARGFRRVPGGHALQIPHLPPLCARARAHV